jgi:hypothetical protein
MNKRNLLFLAILFSAGVMVLSSCKDDDEPTTAKLHGTVTFENVPIWTAWVDSGAVQLNIFPEFSLDPYAGWGEVPDNLFGPGSLGGFFPIGAPINTQDPIEVEYEAGITGFSYEIELDPGTYSALAVGFKHYYIDDSFKSTAPIGVYYGNPDVASYGVRISISTPMGPIQILDDPAPTILELEAGDDFEYNFKADFALVPQYFQL